MTTAQPLKQLLADRVPFDGMGHEAAQDAAAHAAAANPEEPVLCFSRAALAERAGAFLEGFPGEVAYAVKANPSAEVVLTLAACGIAVFDVASIAEIELVRALAPAARIHYHNPVKSRSEITRAYRDFGVTRFAADSPEEIAKIAAITGGDESVEIAVRFRLPSQGASAHDFSSKFGVAPEEAGRLLRLVEEHAMRPLLTFHPGSQCTDPTAYARHIAEAARIAAGAGVRLAALNVGGGFPSRYLGTAVPALPEFFAAIRAAAVAALRRERRSAPRVRARPRSRGHVDLAARAGEGGEGRRLRGVPQRRHLRLAARSRPGSLPAAALPRHPRRRALYGPARRLHRLWADVRSPRPAPQRTDAAADLREDDYVEFGTLGAYATATATRFNGYGARA